MCNELGCQRRQRAAHGAVQIHHPHALGAKAKILLQPPRHEPRILTMTAKSARLDDQLEPGGMPSLLKSFKRSRSCSVECAGVSCSGSFFFSSVIAMSSGGSCFRHLAESAVQINLLQRRTWHGRECRMTNETLMGRPIVRSWGGF